MTLTGNNVITLRKLTLKVTAEKGITPPEGEDNPLKHFATHHSVWLEVEKNLFLS